MFFSQWKILFGEVCGYDVDSPSDKIKKLAEFSHLGVKDPKPAELLFAVHTYYALFMKLLAAQTGKTGISVTGGLCPEILCRTTGGMKGLVSIFDIRPQYKAWFCALRGVVLCGILIDDDSEV